MQGACQRTAKRGLSHVSRLAMASALCAGGVALWPVCSPAQDAGPQAPSGSSALRPCIDDASASLQAMIDRSVETRAGTGRAQVRLPAGQCMTLSRPVRVPSHVMLSGQGTRITLASAVPAFILENSDDVEISGFEIRGPGGAGEQVVPVMKITDAAHVVVRETRVIDPPGGIAVDRSRDVRLSDIEVEHSRLHGISIRASSSVAVERCRMVSNRGFGVILAAGAHRNRVEGCWTDRNGLELIGVEADSHDNVLAGNHAEGTGDNGISVTGFNNRVTGNLAVRNAGNGIGIYGSRNSVEGNDVRENGLGHARQSEWLAGIYVAPGFGGLGSGNLIARNACADSRPVPTQVACVYLSDRRYPVWTPNRTYRQNTFVMFEGRIYRADTEGVSVAPPGHAPESAGQVNWRFVREVDPSLGLGRSNLVLDNAGVKSAVPGQKPASGEP